MTPCLLWRRNRTQMTPYVPQQGGVCLCVCVNQVKISVVIAPQKWKSSEYWNCCYNPGLDRLKKKMYVAPQNSRHQKGDMNQAPYWRLIPVRRFRSGRGLHGDLEPGVCAPPLCSLYWPVNNLSPECAVTSLIAQFEIGWLICKIAFLWII
jgi:hypothetical protein